MAWVNRGGTEKGGGELCIACPRGILYQHLDLDDVGLVQVKCRGRERLPGWGRPPLGQLLQWGSEDRRRDLGCCRDLAHSEAGMVSCLPPPTSEPEG